MVAELLRAERPLSSVTPADAADAADTRTTPSSPRLRTVADGCGRTPEAEQDTPPIRKHPQASANPQTRALPSFPQHPQIPRPTGSTIAAQRRRLTAAAVAQGIPAEIVLALDDLDVDGCQWLDEPGLRRYAQIVQENYLRAHGAIPLRPVRRDTPQSVTCATCAHQQRRADTSDAGMHGCAKGHPLHYAHEQHACRDFSAAKPGVSVATHTPPAIQSPPPSRNRK